VIYSKDWADVAREGTVMHRYGDIPYTILGVLVLSAAIAVVVRGVIIIPKFQTS
jgi:hypothetical protein